MRFMAKRIDTALGAQVRIRAGLEIIVFELSARTTVLTGRTITARTLAARTLWPTLAGLSTTLTRALSRVTALALTLTRRPVGLAVASHMPVGARGAATFA